VRFVLASTNPAKVTAVAEYVRPPVRIEPLPPGIAQVASAENLETGSSFAAIAGAKAQFWSTKCADEFVLGSDGGLTIPALGDAWNPTRTSRFVSPEVTVQSRIEALLNLCRHLHGAERRIGWTESLALARNGEVIEVWSAESPPGHLVDEATSLSPTTGFWIPRIWICPESGGKLLAELDERERRARRDHWSQLADRLVNWASVGGD
jgi:inosine/xanthosine triphosphate pyrophosphatase family protein